MRPAGHRGDQQRVLDFPEAPSTLAVSTSAQPEAMFALSDAVRWLRPWMAAVIVVVAIVTVFTAFAEDMPVFHHLAVPAATVVIVAAWTIELAGVRWSRLAL